MLLRATIPVLGGFAIIFSSQAGSSSVAPAPREELGIDVTRAASCKRSSRVGDTISVHYNGSLIDGRIFDSSYQRQNPITFTLGSGQVIRGWDLGLLDMCIGEERLLTIPSSLAYGNRAVGIIGPGATLIFETLLVAIEPQSDHQPVEEVEDVPEEGYDDSLEGEDDITGVGKEGDGHEGLSTTEPSIQSATAVPESATTSAIGLATASRILPAKPSDPPTRSGSVSNTAPASVASQQPIPQPQPPPESGPDGEDGGSRPGEGECRLLGPFALVVQAGLGLLAISSLVWKRFRERPRRPFKIWLFDASKQVIGSALLHVLNIVMSMFSTSDFNLTLQAQEISTQLLSQANKQVNPCSWYLINIAIDTTIGIPILVFFLRLLTHGFSLTPLARPLESIKSGHYGQPPKAKWWLKQSLIYFIGLVLMKLCVFFIITMLPWIALIGDWALRWTEGSEALQVTFVMFVFPLVMNALQYYIIDSFIKEPSSGEVSGLPDEQASYRSIDSRDSIDSDVDGLEGGDEAGKKSVATAKRAEPGTEQ